MLLNPGPPFQAPMFQYTTYHNKLMLEHMQPVTSLAPTVVLCGPGNSVLLASLSGGQRKGLTNPSATYCKLLHYFNVAILFSLRTTNNKTRSVAKSHTQDLGPPAARCPTRDCQALGGTALRRTIRTRIVFTIAQTTVFANG